MAFLDIHSHILPEVDDGAKDVKESLELLDMLRKQGVNNVCLTPHFDASYDNIEDFEKVVDKSYKKLKRAMEGKDLPTVFLGAEVLYFPGIGKSEEIMRLCLENTHYLLLEFGQVSFDNMVCDDIINLKDEIGVMPIIAHFERYKKLKLYKNLLGIIANGDAIGQINAGSLLTKPYKRQALKLLKYDLVSLVGSDAHSVEDRPPQIKAALDIIADRFGGSESNRLIKNSEYILTRMGGGK